VLPGQPAGMSKLLPHSCVIPAYGLVVTVWCSSQRRERPVGRGGHGGSGGGAGAAAACRRRRRCCHRSGRGATARWHGKPGAVTPGLGVPDGGCPEVCSIIWCWNGAQGSMHISRRMSVNASRQCGVRAEQPLQTLSPSPLLASIAAAETMKHADRAGLTRGCRGQAATPSAGRPHIPTSTQLEAAAPPRLSTGWSRASVP
jgi:hypothetical protein